MVAIPREYLKIRLRKVSLNETPNGDAVEARKYSEFPVHGGAAARTERVVDALVPRRFVENPGVSSPRHDLIGKVPAGDLEDTSRTLLAVVTM